MSKLRVVGAVARFSLVRRREREASREREETVMTFFTSTVGPTMSISKWWVVGAVRPVLLYSTVRSCMSREDTARCPSCRRPRMTGQSAKAGRGPHLPSDGQKWAGRGSIHSAGETAVSRVLERRWRRGWGLSFGGRHVSRIRRAGMRGWCDCIANEGCVGRDEWLTGQV